MKPLFLSGLIGLAGLVLAPVQVRAHGIESSLERLTSLSDSLRLESCAHRREHGLSHRCSPLPEVEGTAIETMIKALAYSRRRKIEREKERKTVCTELRVFTFVCE
jgi:hypothetical protein